MAERVTTVPSCAGGFTAAAALSFVLAFILVSMGILLFSLAGNIYQPASEGHYGPPSDSDNDSEKHSPVRHEASRLLSSAFVTRGRTPVGIGVGFQPSPADSLQERSDRNPKPADVELECRDT